MHASLNYYLTTSKFNKMVNKEDMEKALDELNAQLLPNYTQITLKFGLEHTTLMRRHKGICVSRMKATSLYHKLLTDTQEEILITQINKLTVRGLSPTSHIVKNLAEEIVGHKVNKNWTAHFVKRHSSHLKSLYLRNIDNLRMKSEYGPHIQDFFDLVAFNFLFLMYLIDKITNTFTQGRKEASHLHTKSSHAIVKDPRTSEPLSSTFMNSLKILQYNIQKSKNKVMAPLLADVLRLPLR
jgi:hypothetical protein